MGNLYGKANTNLEGNCHCESTNGWLISCGDNKTPVPVVLVMEMATTQMAAVVVLAVRLNSMRSASHFKYILALCCLLVLVSCGGEKTKR